MASSLSSSSSSSLFEGRNPTGVFRSRRLVFPSTPLSLGNGKRGRDGCLLHTKDGGRGVAASSHAAASIDTEKNLGALSPEMNDFPFYLVQKKD